MKHRISRAILICLFSFIFSFTAIVQAQHSANYDFFKPTLFDNADIDLATPNCPLDFSGFSNGSDIFSYDTALVRSCLSQLNYIIDNFMRPTGSYAMALKNDVIDVLEGGAITQSTWYSDRNDPRHDPDNFRNIHPTIFKDNYPFAVWTLDLTQGATGLGHVADAFACILQAIETYGDIEGAVTGGDWEDGLDAAESLYDAFQACGASFETITGYELPDEIPILESILTTLKECVVNDPTEACIDNWATTDSLFFVTMGELANMEDWLEMVVLLPQDTDETPTQDDDKSHDSYTAWVCEGFCTSDSFEVKRAEWYGPQSSDDKDLGTYYYDATMTGHDFNDLDTWEMQEAHTLQPRLLASEYPSIVWGSDHTSLGGSRCTLGYSADIWSEHFRKDVKSVRGNWMNSCGLTWKAANELYYDLFPAAVEAVEELNDQIDDWVTTLIVCAAAEGAPPACSGPVFPFDFVPRTVKLISAYATALASIQKARNAFKSDGGVFVDELEMLEQLTMTDVPDFMNVWDDSEVFCDQAICKSDGSLHDNMLVINDTGPGAPDYSRGNFATGAFYSYEPQINPYAGAPDIRVLYSDDLGQISGVTYQTNSKGKNYPIAAAADTYMYDNITDPAYVNCDAQTGRVGATQYADGQACGPSVTSGIYNFYGSDAEQDHLYQGTMNPDVLFVGSADGMCSSYGFLCISTSPSESFLCRTQCPMGDWVTDPANCM